GKQRGVVGKFGLDAPAWTDSREPYRVTTSWDTQQPFNIVDTGWRAPPAFSPLTPHPDAFFGALSPTKRVYPALCRAGRMVHTVHLELPGDVSAVDLPAPIEKSTPLFQFREQWSREAHGLQVRVEVSSFARARVCTPQEVDAVTAAFLAAQGRANPVLHFARTDSGGEADRHDHPGQTTLGAAPRN